MSKVVAFIKKRKVLFIILAVVIIVIIVVAGFLNSLTSAGMAMLSAPSVTQLSRQDVENVIVATGSTASSEKRAVVGLAPTGTEIVELNIAVGDYVKKDEVLATLDDQALQDKVSDAQESYYDKSSDIFYSDQINDFDLSVTQNSVNDAQADYDSAVASDAATQKSIQDQIFENNVKINELRAAANKDIQGYLLTWATAFYTSAPPANPTLQDYDKYAQDLENDLKTLSPDSDSKIAEADIAQRESQLATNIKPYNDAISTLNSQSVQSTASVSNSLNSLQTAQNNLTRQSLQAQSTDNTNAQALDDLNDNIHDAIDDLDDLLIRSPLNGVITEVNYQKGELFGASALCTIQDLDNLEIIATVPSYDVVKLKTGMQATFTTDSTGDTKMRGTVTAISPIATDTSGGFSVTISVDDTNQDLRAGVPSQVTFMLEASTNAFAVPIDAVVEMNGSSFIYVYDTMPTTEQLAMGEEDGRRMIRVQKGLESDYLVEITSTELFEGMLVLDDPMGMNVNNMMQGQMPGGIVITDGGPPSGGGGNRPSGGGN